MSAKKQQQQEVDLMEPEQQEPMPGFDDLADDDPEDGLSLESLLDEAEEEAEHDPEAEAEAEAEAADQQERAGRMAKALNRGMWSTVARFCPVVQPAVAQVYGQGSQDLPGKIQDGEKVIEDLLMHYGVTPEWLDKAINHPALGAGLYVGTSIYGAVQAQKLAEQYAALQAQQPAAGQQQAEGGQSGEES